MERIPDVMIYGLTVCMPQPRSNSERLSLSRGILSGAQRRDPIPFSNHCDRLLPFGENEASETPRIPYIPGENARLHEWAFERSLVGRLRVLQVSAAGAGPTNSIFPDRLLTEAPAVCEEELRYEQQEASDLEYD